MSSGIAAKIRSMLTLRNLILMKLVILVAAILGMTGQLKFGDQVVQAEDAKPNAPAKTSDAKAEPSKAANAAKPATAVASATATPPKSAAETENAEGEAPKRRSFLDGLLNLPGFDKSTAQREEISRFLDLAEQKQRQIHERVSVLEKREAYLKELEDAIETKVRALEDEKILFQQSLQREKDLAEDRLEHLVEYYKKMEAKKAAPVMEKLDKDLVVKLFNKIPQKQVTLILTAMSPEKSVEITEYYGRVRSGREYEMLKEMNQFLVDKFQQCKGMPEQQAPAH